MVNKQTPKKTLQNAAAGILKTGISSVKEQINV